jgi:hypothetical protein
MLRFDVPTGAHIYLTLARPTVNGPSSGSPATSRAIVLERRLAETGALCRKHCAMSPLAMMAARRCQQDDRTLSRLAGNASIRLRSCKKSTLVMVPGERIELPTNGLQNRCSTAELTRLEGPNFNGLRLPFALPFTRFATGLLPSAAVFPPRNLGPQVLVDKRSVLLDPR